MFTKISFIVIMHVVLTACIFAQNEGAISGKIIDKATKQPLAAVNITVMGRTEGTVAAGNDGFLIKKIPEGLYKLRISCIGYESHIVPDVRVVRGKTYAAGDIELEEAPMGADGVTVAADRFGFSKEMPVSNFQYTREEIVRAPGAAGDIFRALEVLPGVSTNGGEFSAFSVRGDAPANNLILIDNIPFSSVSHFAELDGGLEIQGGRFSIFSQGLIDKANFQSGGFPAKFGGKRASMLDLTLREGNMESPTAKASYDLMGWEAYYDGPAYGLPSTSVMLSARNIDFRNVLKLVDEEGDGNSKFADYILKTVTTPDPENKISLLGIFSTESHYRGVDDYYKGKDVLALELSDQRDDKVLLGMNWRRLIGGGGFVNTCVYYNTQDTREKLGQISIDPRYDRKPERADLQTRYPLYEYAITDRQLGVKSDLTMSVTKEFTFTAGAAIERGRSTSDLVLTMNDTLFVYHSGETNAGQNYLIVLPSEFNHRFDRPRVSYAGYAEASYSPSDEATLNAGARVEYDDLSRQSYASPRLNGSYRLNDLTSVNFAVGVFYQQPTLRTIAFNPANMALVNEKAWHFVFGIDRYLDDALKVTAEGYYKKLDRLVVEPNSNSNGAANTGSGYSYGLDLSLKRRFVDDFYGQVNYSYSVSQVREHAGGALHPSDFNQPQMFNVLAGYQLDEHWSFSCKWKYATGRPKDTYIVHADVLHNRAELRYAQEIISTTTGRFTAYHALNVRVDYRHQFSKLLAISTFIDIMNLYGRENETGASFQPESGKVQYSTFPMMPTIGFKLEL